jgi:hypothetical protein
METARDRAQDRRRLAAPPGRAGSTEGSFASLFEVVVGLEPPSTSAEVSNRACALGSDTFAMSLARVPHGLAHHVIDFRGVMPRIVFGELPAIGH